jgi:HAMP domain-containing protein
MKISMRLSLAGLLSVGVVVLISAVPLFATRQVRQELATNETAGEIVNAVSSLRYLTLEYALRHEERVQTQWQLRHASLAKLLTGSAEFAGFEEQAIMERLHHTHESLPTLFTELLSSYQDRVTDKGKSALLEELQTRLMGQMMNRTQDMIGDALTLANRSRAQVVGAQERAGFAIIAFGGVLVCVIGVTLFLAVRSVSRPLAKLREGTAIVGAGNLDYRLGVTTRDEIGDLSRAFDQMTETLQATTLSRDELAVGEASRPATPARAQHRWRDSAGDGAGGSSPQRPRSLEIGGTAECNRHETCGDACGARGRAGEICAGGGGFDYSTHAPEESFGSGRISGEDRARWGRWSDATAERPRRCRGIRRRYVADEWF